MGSYSYVGVSVLDVHENDVEALLTAANPYSPYEPLTKIRPDHGIVRWEGEVKNGSSFLTDEPGTFTHDGKWVATGRAPMLELVEKNIPFDINDGGDGGDIPATLTFWRPKMDKPAIRYTVDGAVVMNFSDLMSMASLREAEDYLSPPALTATDM